MSAIRKVRPGSQLQNLPRRGAKDAARQSRNRTGKADRKIEDRKKRASLHVSVFNIPVSISLPLGLPPRPTSRKFSRSPRANWAIAVQRGTAAMEQDRQTERWGTEK
jgi:hypothetical protein